MTKKKSNHYIDNEKFYDALCEWKERVVEADESGEERPPVTEYIGECFVLMATNLARRLCFTNYAYKEEMIGDAIENAILYAHIFKPEKSKNAFAYFTQMMYYAFLRRIQKEKKQMYVKYKLLEQDPDYQGTVQWSDEDPHEKLTAEKRYGLSENDIQKFTPKDKKKKSGGGTLDSIL